MQRLDEMKMVAAHAFLFCFVLEFRLDVFIIAFVLVCMMGIELNDGMDGWMEMVICFFLH